MLERQRVLNTNVSIGSYDRFIYAIVELSRKARSSFVCFANVHMLVTAKEDSEFAAIVNAANIVAPDGKPVSLLLNALYNRKQVRVCGMDILPDLLDVCEKKSLSVFFYGSTLEVQNAIQTKAKADYPALKIAGGISPPFRELSTQEDIELVAQINEAKPDLVLVSLGCPKQEKWMHAHLNVVNSCMLGLGQAFLTYIGAEKRLPLWARQFGLEWAYRLYLEPRRLWKRYLLGNTSFILSACKALLLKRVVQ